MPSIQRAVNYALHNRNQFLDSLVKNLGFLFSDRIYLGLRYRFQMGRRLNLRSPVLFTEKLQWLKLYNRKDIYTTMVDKLLAKEYVSNIIGEEYIIPTLGYWDKAEDIDWDSLPNQFVLKTTHAGGGNGVVICTDYNNFDKKSAISRLSRSLNGSNYNTFREWPYKNVRKRVIAEKFMKDLASDSIDLTDYKFYCFNGQPKYCQVIRDRHIKESIDFYDTEWTLMPFVGLNPKCKNGDTPQPKPINLDIMLDICKKLSKDIPFVRVDLYEINQHVYFGELTFFPASGFGRFTPSEWDKILGDLIVLPS